MVQERAAAGLVVERPTQRMLDQARPVLVMRNLPQLLQADAVFLHVGLGVELELFDDQLTERAARPFGQQGIFGAQFQARLVVRLGIAVAVDAEDTGDHAGHRTVGLIEHFGAGHARIDFDAQGFGLLGQPARQVAEAGDIATVIIHIAGFGQGRDVQRALGAEIDELVGRNGGFQRRAQFFPIREQLGQARRIDDRARQDMGADFRALFQHGDADLGPVLRGLLFQADRRRKARRPATDDHDIVVHRVPRHHLGFGHSVFSLGSGKPVLFMAQAPHVPGR